MIEPEDDVPNFRCKDCIHATHKDCPRIDFEKIQFAKPFFKCESRSLGIPCSAFLPSEHHVVACSKWNGFWDWWGKYVDTWLPYKNTKRLVYFTLNKDNSVWYGVPLMDYLQGKLCAVEKMYCKQSRKSPVGYVIVHEKLNGFDLRLEAEKHV